MCHQRVESELDLNTGEGHRHTSQASTIRTWEMHVSVYDRHSRGSLTFVPPENFLVGRYLAGIKWNSQHSQRIR